MTTNRTPEALAYDCLEKAHERCSDHLEYEAGCNPVSYNEILKDEIAQAIREDRQERVCIPDRETFKRDLGLKSEPRGESYNKGVMDAYDALVHRIRCSNDTLGTQGGDVSANSNKGRVLVLPNSEEIYQKALAYSRRFCSTGNAHFDAAILDIRKWAYADAYEDAAKSTPHITRESLEKVRKALDLYSRRADEEYQEAAKQALAILDEALSAHTKEGEK